jgi:hypothetical protein
MTAEGKSASKALAGKAKGAVFSETITRQNPLD